MIKVNLQKTKIKKSNKFISLKKYESTKDSSKKDAN